MNTRLHVVIFSYNRAMQLDATLRSIYEYITGVEISASILYHYSDEHESSYRHLINEWGERSEISFHLRQIGRSFSKEVLPYFFKYYKNLPRYLKYSSARDSSYKFKSQFERLIASNSAEFTMLNTDDVFFYRHCDIPVSILETILKNPLAASYRMYVGRNQTDCPKNLQEIDGSLYWSYNDKTLYRHWKYPFAVDATIYNTKGLMEILKSQLYYSPSSLEGFVCDFCKMKNLLLEGYGPYTSCAVNLPINKVQVENANYHGSYSVTALMNLYNEGYRLCFKPEGPVTQSAYCPKNLTFIRENETRILEG